MFGKFLRLRLLYLVVLCIAGQNSLANGNPKLPYGFIPNKGHINMCSGSVCSQTLFKASLAGLDVYLKKDRITYVLYTVRPVAPPTASLSDSLLALWPTQDTVSLRRVDLIFEGANANPVVEGMGASAFPVFLMLSGVNQSACNANIFEKVHYTDIYPNIDAVFYVTPQGHFKYEFIVHPGADPNSIQLTCSGAQNHSVTPAGDWAIQTELGTLTEAKPITYQMDGDTHKVYIPSQYAASGANSKKFTVGGYDSAKDLIIDPFIRWGTFFGGIGGTSSSSTDIRESITDALYTNGQTNLWLLGFSTTLGQPPNGQLVVSPQPVPNPFANNIFDINTFLVEFGTGYNITRYYIYGGNMNDRGRAMVFDQPHNRIWITGFVEHTAVCPATLSNAAPPNNNYPITINADGFEDQGLGGRTDWFIAAIDISNNLQTSPLVFSSPFGSNEGGCSATSEVPLDIELDADGNVYVAGHLEINTTEDNGLFLGQNHPNNDNGHCQGTSRGRAVLIQLSNPNVITTTNITITNAYVRGGSARDRFNKIAFHRTNGVGIESLYLTGVLIGTTEGGCNFADLLSNNTTATANKGIILKMPIELTNPIWSFIIGDNSGGTHEYISDIAFNGEQLWAVGVTQTEMTSTVSPSTLSGRNNFSHNSINDGTYYEPNANPPIVSANYYCLPYFRPADVLCLSDPMQNLYSFNAVANLYHASVFRFTPDPANEQRWLLDYSSFIGTRGNEIDDVSTNANFTTYGFVERINVVQTTANQTDIWVTGNVRFFSAMKTHYTTFFANESDNIYPKLPGCVISADPLNCTNLDPDNDVFEYVNDFNPLNSDVYALRIDPSRVNPGVNPFTYFTYLGGCRQEITFGAIPVSNANRQSPGILIFGQTRSNCEATGGCAGGLTRGFPLFDRDGAATNAYYDEINTASGNNSPIDGFLIQLGEQRAQYGTQNPCCVGCLPEPNMPDYCGCTVVQPVGGGGGGPE